MTVFAGFCHHPPPPPPRAKKKHEDGSRGSYENLEKIQCQRHGNLSSGISFHHRSASHMHKAHGCATLVNQLCLHQRQYSQTYCRNQRVDRHNDPREIGNQTASTYLSNRITPAPHTSELLNDKHIPPSPAPSKIHPSPATITRRPNTLPSPYVVSQ